MKSVQIDVTLPPYNCKAPFDWSPEGEAGKAALALVKEAREINPKARIKIYVEEHHSINLEELISSWEKK